MSAMLSEAEARTKWRGAQMLFARWVHKFRGSGMDSGSGNHDAFPYDFNRRLLESDPELVKVLKLLEELRIAHLLTVHALFPDYVFPDSEAEAARSEPEALPLTLAELDEADDEAEAVGSEPGLLPLTFAELEPNTKCRKTGSNTGSSSASTTSTAVTATASDTTDAVDTWLELLDM